MLMFRPGVAVAFVIYLFVDASGELSALFKRPLATGFGPPAGDFCVISVEQYFRNCHASEFPRSRELRIFQQAFFCKRFVTAAGFVSQNSWDQPHDRVDDQHGRDFASVGNVVPSGDFQRRKALANAIIEPFVAAT